MGERGQGAAQANGNALISLLLTLGAHRREGTHCLVALQAVMAMAMAMESQHVLIITS